MQEVEWLSASEAAKVVGPRRGGKPTHHLTIRQWWLFGLRGVVLRSEDRAGVLCTRREWIAEFLEDVAKVKRLEREALIRRHKAKRAARLTAADRKLQAAASAEMQARREKSERRKGSKKV